MRSFASVAAFASIAFATVASALPAMGGSAGLSRRDDGVADVQTTVSKVTTIAGVANGLNAVVANANSHQSRYAPSDGYHADLVTLVAQATGLTKVEVLAQALAIVNLDVTHIDIKALLPFDLNIIAVVWHYAPWIKIETIVEQLGTKVELLKDANVNIANAQANQKTGGGGNYRREGPDVGSATGALGGLGAGGLGAVVGGLGKTKAARADYRGVPDVLVDVRVKVQDLCHELSGRISAAASASIALDASLQILAEIKARLIDARAEIEAIVAANVEGALCLKGKVITVQAIAEIYASIVVAICVTLQLVVKACAEVKTDVLAALIVDICVALAACITLGAKLAAGLVVDIRALIDVCVRIIVDLKLDVFIQLFKIGSGY